MGQFFEELSTYLKDNRDLVRADEYEAYIKREEARFMAYLYDHETNKQRIIENVTDDLLYSYYDARIAVGEAAKKYGNSAPETQALRGVMNGYCSTVTLVIVRIARRAGALYSENFISGWEARADYFPFGEIMRGATPNPGQAAPATSTGQPAAEQPVTATASTKRGPRNAYTERLRTHIVYELMKRAGIKIGTYDKTDIARVIIPAIGGNPDVRVGDSNVYKKHLSADLTPQEKAIISDLFEKFDKEQTNGK